MTFGGKVPEVLNGPAQENAAQDGPAAIYDDDGQDGECCYTEILQREDAKVLDDDRDFEKHNGEVVDHQGPVESLG